MMCGKVRYETRKEAKKALKLINRLNPEYNITTERVPTRL
jgi:hypothetical protein